MKFEDRFRLQSEATEQVYLFKAGLFYHAYNEGACWACIKVKPLKVHAKVLGTKKRTYFYVGFPQNALSHYLPAALLQSAEDFPKYLLLRNVSLTTPEVYARWAKANSPLNAATTIAATV